MQTKDKLIMHRKLILAMVLLCFFGLTITSQENLWFRHIDSKGYDIRTVYRDVDGVVWLGTSSGLVSMPQLMSHNPKAYHREHEGLTTAIDHISGDSLGWLCIKTQNRDVILYTPRSDHYQADPTRQLSQEGIHVSKDFTMLYDECSRRWIWKDDKLYAEGWNESFNGEQIQGISCQPTQAVILTSKALYYISTANGKMIRRVPLPENINNYAYLYGVGDIEMWVQTGRTICMYDYPSNRWAPAVTMPSSITGVQIDNDGRRWVSTQNDGIFIYDRKGQTVRHLQHDIWNPNSLRSNRINMLFFERETNTMWIAYWKGGLSLCSTKQQIGQLYRINKLTDQNVHTDVLTFCPSADSKQIYAGTEDHGVFIYDTKGQWNCITDIASATALYSDSQGALWMGLYGKGLVRQTSDGQQLYFPGDSPYAIAENRMETNNRWLYTAMLGKGVWRLNPQTGEISDTKIGTGFVLDLHFYGKNLYAATTDGFFVMTPNQRWRKIFDGNFRSFCIDHLGYYWLLGDVGYEGLTLLDPQEKLVDVPSGLRNAALKSIIVDKNNQTWITTDKELLMLRFRKDQTNKDNFEQFLFNISPNGQNLYYNYHAIMIDHDNRLWLGTTTGYQCFSIPQLMSQMERVENVSPLLIGSISVNDEVCSPGKIFNERRLFNEDVVFLRNLDLNHNENNLVIECTQSNFYDFTSCTYYYQLKGFSDDWHQMKDQTIVLSNLPPGRYQLMVKTQSSDESLLLRIHIASPWWQTWWAYMLYLLLFALLIYGIILYFNNKRTYQLKLHELELQRQQQEQVNEIKLRFFTNISHDLRTPLSLIIGPAEELIKQVRDPKKLTSLQIIQRNADHLLSLVNQILDFRRLEFGREKLILSQGDLVALLEDICTSFQLKGEKEHIHFTFLSSVEKIETAFDRDKTTKIMMNLLSNAFKFTDEGDSIMVRLSVNDEQAVISVADTGVGIPDADKTHIFERFFQSESGNRISMGSGIGLHIVQEYVRLQGGDITVSDQQDGKGTIFSFTIPLREIAKQSQQTEKKLVKDESESKSNILLPRTGSPLPTLLLVDDNHDLLTYMSQALSNHYEILTATNGVEALNLLQDNDIDITVSDVMMPEMDGLELCRRIKTDINTSHIPIVLLTAKSMNNDELLGLEAGADDYITKPFSMDILRKRVSNLVERNRQQHERFAKEIDINPSEITVTSLDEQFISRAIKIVEEHISDPEFNVEQLSHEIGMHRSQVYKKIQHLTGKTPILFIRLLRIKRGKQLLEQSGLYVSEIAYKVGLSPRNFTKYFKEEFGITPKDHLNKE